MLPILDAGVIGAGSAGPILVDLSKKLGSSETIGEIQSVKVYKESDGTDVTSAMYSAENSQVSGQYYYCWINGGGGSPSTTPVSYILYMIIKSNTTPAKQYPVYIRFQVVDPYASS